MTKPWNRPKMKRQTPNKAICEILAGAYELFAPPIFEKPGEMAMKTRLTKAIIPILMQARHFMTIGDFSQPVSASVWWEFL